MGSEYVVYHGLRSFERDGLEVREENAGAGDVRFSLFVDSPEDGVVGTLEQEALAVGYQLHAGIGIGGI
jgi:hypothetical protein